MGWGGRELVDVSVLSTPGTPVGPTFAKSPRFIVRVGTPEQYFSVLPSTANQQTWVPIPEGCDSSRVGNFSNCGDSRGVWPFENENSEGFQSNQSSTWETIGIYELYLEEHLGIDGNGLFGYDSVGLGASGTAVEKQVVAGIATSNFWLGSLGLGANYTNFSDEEQPSSLLRTLKDSGSIPSLSYGYTAGAPYSKPLFFTVKKRQKERNTAPLGYCFKYVLIRTRIFESRRQFDPWRL